jgi:hypothetical protein
MPDRATDLALADAGRAGDEHVQVFGVLICAES